MATLKPAIRSTALRVLPPEIFYKDDAVCRKAIERAFRLVFWLLILVAILCGPGARAQSGSSISDFLKNGEAAAERGDLRNARVAFLQARRLAPGEAEVNFRLGLLLGQLGAEKEAAASFRDAIHARPKFAEAHYNLALAIIADPLGKVDWPGAMTQCRLALKYRANYPDALHLLGVALMTSGNTEGAIGNFRAALHWAPNSAVNHFDLGKAWERLGDNLQAQSEYRLALANPPVYPDAEIAWAKLLIQARDLASAESHLKNVLRANPDLETAHYSLGRVFLLEKKPALAKVEFSQANELRQRETDAIQSNRQSNKGLDAAAKGNLAAAVELLRNAVRLKPDSALAHYNFGLLLADRGDYSKARAQLVDAISLSQSDPRFYSMLGRVAAREGAMAEAHFALERAAELDPTWRPTAQEATILKQNESEPSSLASDYRFGAESETADAHYAFGVILSRRNNWLGATGEWLRALSLQPASLDARNNLAVAYAHLGDLKRSELQFRRMLLIAPSSAAAHFGLAIVALQQSRNGEAAAELKDVIRTEPNYPHAQALLSQISSGGVKLPVRRN